MSKQEQAKLDYKEDHIIFTCGLYELFMSYGKDGMDALRVYTHLFYTARRQGTNQTWANNKYIHAGIHLGDLKIKKAKTLLKKLGLVEYKKSRKGNKYGPVYTKINRMPTKKIMKKILNKSSTGINSTIVDNNYSSKDPTKCLNKETKCLNKETKCLNKESTNSSKEELLDSSFNNIFKDKLFINFLETWNKNKNTINHKLKESKTIKEIYLCYTYLKNGLFINTKDISLDWLKKNNISLKHKEGLSDKQMIKGLENYLLQFEEGYWPYRESQKKQLYRNLSKVLYDFYNKKCPSAFLKCLFNPPKPLVDAAKQKALQIYEKYLPVYKDVLDFRTDTEKHRALRHIKNLTKIQKSICTQLFKTKYGIVDRAEIQSFTFSFRNEVGTVKNPEPLIKNHALFLGNCKNNWKKFDISVANMNPNNGMWQHFEKWFKEQTSIILEPTKEEKKNLIHTYEYNMEHMK